MIDASNLGDDVPRISSTELARRPGQLMEQVLRETRVIIQNHGRDVAVVLDIEEYRRLVQLSTPAYR